MICLIGGDGISQYVVNQEQRPQRVAEYKTAVCLDRHALEHLFPAYFAFFNRTLSGTQKFNALKHDVFAQMNLQSEVQAISGETYMVSSALADNDSYVNLVKCLLKKNAIKPMEAFMLIYPAAEIPFFLDSIKKQVPLDNAQTQSILAAANRAAVSNFVTPLPALGYLLYTTAAPCRQVPLMSSSMPFDADTFDEKTVDELSNLTNLFVQQTIDELAPSQRSYLAPGIALAAVAACVGGAAWYANKSSAESDEDLDVTADIEQDKEAEKLALSRQPMRS